MARLPASTCSSATETISSSARKGRTSRALGHLGPGLLLARQPPVLEPFEERRSRHAELFRYPLPVVAEAAQRGFDDLSLELFQHLLERHAPRKLRDGNSRIGIELLIEGEIVGVDQRPLSEQQRAMHCIAKLSDVPRPGVPLEPLGG